MAPQLVRAFVVVAVLATAASSIAQFRGGFGSRVRPRLPTEASYDGGFTFCRGMYTSGRRDGSRNGWTTDYPDADINFSIRLSELTKVTISKTSDGEPNHLVVSMTDPYLFQCPFVMMTDVGEILIDGEEVAALRQYLDKGGFLWVDDFWGPWAWDAWEREIAKVLPPGEFPIADVTTDHAIFRTLFIVPTLPQIPSINSWRGMGGGTSEL